MFCIFHFQFSITVRQHECKQQFIVLANKKILCPFWTEDFYLCNDEITEQP